jgi:hypothetical protein
VLSLPTIVRDIVENLSCGVGWQKLAGRCLSLSADKQATGFRPAIDCKRTNAQVPLIVRHLGQRPLRSRVVTVPQVS